MEAIGTLAGGVAPYTCTATGPHSQTASGSPTVTLDPGPAGDGGGTYQIACSDSAGQTTAAGEVTLAS